MSFSFSFGRNAKAHVWRTGTQSATYQPKNISRRKVCLLSSHPLMKIILLFVYWEPNTTTSCLMTLEHPNKKDTNDLVWRVGEKKVQK